MTDTKREIKFRAWQKAHKKMHYNVNLYSMGRGEMVKAQLDNKSFMDSIGLSCEVMQFTGLLDKNKVEIYESDIVEVEYGRGKVIFHVGCFMIEWIDDPEANMELLSMRNAKFGHVREDLVVIGNIFEHPHLLTPKP